MEENPEYVGRQRGTQIAFWAGLVFAVALIAVWVSSALNEADSPVSAAAAGSPTSTVDVTSVPPADEDAAAPSSEEWIDFEVDEDGTSFGRMPKNDGTLTAEELSALTPDYVGVLKSGTLEVAGFVESRLLFDETLVMSGEPLEVVDRSRNLVGYWHRSGGFAALGDPTPESDGEVIFTE